MCVYVCTRVCVYACVSIITHVLPIHSSLIPLGSCTHTQVPIQVHPQVHPLVCKPQSCREGGGAVCTSRCGSLTLSASPGHCCHCPLPSGTLGLSCRVTLRSGQTRPPGSQLRKTPVIEGSGLAKAWQALSFVSITGLGHTRELPSETHKGRRATPTAVHGGLLGEVETALPSRRRREGGRELGRGLGQKQPGLCCLRRHPVLHSRASGHLTEAQELGCRDGGSGPTRGSRAASPRK